MCEVRASIFLKLTDIQETASNITGPLPKFNFLESIHVNWAVFSGENFWVSLALEWENRGCSRATASNKGLPAFCAILQTTQMLSSFQLRNNFSEPCSFSEPCPKSQAYIYFKSERGTNSSRVSSQRCRNKSKFVLASSRKATAFRNKSTCSEQFFFIAACNEIDVKNNHCSFAKSSELW